MCSRKWELWWEVEFCRGKLIRWNSIACQARNSRQAIQHKSCRHTTGKEQTERREIC